MRYLYTFLFYLFLPFIGIRLLWRSRYLSEYRYRWRERLGYCPFVLKNSIWIHAVSVGETIAAAPLIKMLKQQNATISIVVTNMTPTGASRTHALFGNSVLQSYIPYDLPSAINRFMRRIKPCVVVIVETELWPNLCAYCKKNQIPLVVVNARLSAKSAKGYQYVKSLTQDLLSAIYALAAQGKADAERFISLGLAKEKITVTGNLKFDLEVPSDLTEKSRLFKSDVGLNRIIWIAASTHPGEEEIILLAHQKIREIYPHALLILVPRHPDRFDQIAELIRQNNFMMARRSRNEKTSLETAVYLGDTMGDLFLLYAVSDVVFVGGSLIPIGGHNLLEPAILAKPILTGPHLFNFADISEMLLAADGLVILNGEELAQSIIDLFKDEKKRLSLGLAGQQVVEQNRGALQKQMELVQSVIANT